MLPPKPAPPPFAVHLALVATQVSFGGGAIVGKFGVHGTNPVLFACIREGVAGPVLCLAAFLRTKVWLPPRRDWGRVACCGFALFSNQLFFILGLKLADPVSGSAWQPSQPIFTLIIAVCVGYEQLSLRRTAGILVAAAGAVFMVAYGGSPGAGTSGPLVFVGHALFFLNCLGTSVYVILTKELLKRHAAISVTGWSYVTGSLMMLATLSVVNAVPGLLAFVCADKDSDVQDSCTRHAWAVPSSMVVPLCYWIVFASIVAYFAMTWANQFAKASTVSAYTVLQPATSGLIASLLVLLNGEGWASTYGMCAPGVQDLGVLGIAAGLAIVFMEPTLQPIAAGPQEARGALVEECCEDGGPQVPSAGKVCTLAPVAANPASPQR